MNETIALPRLATLLASRAGIEQADAEKFIRQFFSQIESSLAVSDEVSIKGLGKFYIDNTRGVNFAPDKEFSDFLNQPFEMFSPVEIGEDTDIDSTYDEVPSSHKEETVIEEVPVIEEETEIIPATEGTPTEQPDENEPHENEPEAVMPEIQDEAQENTDADEHNETEPEYVSKTVAVYPVRRRRSVAGYILTAVICLVIGFFLRDFVGMWKHATETPSDTTIVEVPMTDSISAVTEALACAIDSAASADETLAVSEANDSNITVADNSKKEVREPVTDAVTPERFLTTMARKYYGRMEYWVFIYLANEDHLGNPNRIRPGTKVVIPDKSEFTEGETPEQTLARAKRLGLEIYARFE